MGTVRKARRREETIFADRDVSVIDVPGFRGGIITVRVGEQSQVVPYSAANREHVISFAAHVADALAQRGSTVEIETSRERTIKGLAALAASRKPPGKKVKS
jgi:hypothetical protein